MWSDYPEIKEKLERVKEILKENIKSREKFFEKELKRMIESGGKLLRPAMFIIGASFGNTSDEEDILRSAAGVELLHLGTLIHDDVIDKASIRRGNKTIHTEYGNNTAIYMGDFLFVKAFKLISKNHEYDDVKYLARGIEEICLGEMRQNYRRYDTEKTPREHIRIMSGKTAALFSMSMYAGSKKTKADENISKILAKGAYYMGIAFQIVDDLLDFSKEEEMKKSVQKDILEGYYTLPVIFAFKSEIGGKIKDLISHENVDIDRVKKLVEESGSVQKTFDLAQKYTKRAITQFEKLPNTKNREVLIEMAGSLLKRNI